MGLLLLLLVVVVYFVENVSQEGLTPPVFVINLDKDTDRYRERFPAIVGKDVDPR